MSVWRAHSMLAAVLGALLLNAPASQGSPGPKRLIQSGVSPSMGGARRVVIDGDSRYALGGARVVRLAAGRLIDLPEAGDLSVAIEIPEALRGAGSLYLEGEYGVEYVTKEDVVRRVRAPLQSQLWRKGETPKVALVGTVGEANRGAKAEVDVIARVVPEKSVGLRLGPIEIPKDAPRLDFSYAVEEPGWADAAPPVRFVLSTVEDRARVLWERRLDPGQDARERRWYEASVSLSSLAGETATFLFRAETAVKGERSMGSVGVFANPVVRSGRDASPSRKNLILISADTLRAHSLGAYGYARATSPNIDRFLGGGGVMVRDAIAPMPFTPSSHMTMFTGLDVCAHNVFGITDALSPDTATLAEWLRADGYETAAFTENAFLVAGGGFDRGFDVYVENRSEELNVVGYARETFEGATEWLRRNRAEPFFLFVHTYQVHAPYSPPRGFEALFKDRSAGELSARHDAYDREIRYLDEILGDFFDELERLGLMEDTVLVLTSDHGEGFGEHQKSIGHNYALWDEVMRVPLFVRADGLLPASTVAETQVGLVDLAPTLLDLLGVAIPSGLDGASFADALRGDPESLAKFAARPVFMRGTPIGQRSEAGAPRSTTGAVRTPRWKLIVRAEGERARLFDLQNRPFETRSVRFKHPEVAEGLLGVLQEHRVECAKRWKQARGNLKTAERAPSWIGDISRQHRKRLEETRRKLESLGYVE